jgi:hypothetical protein
MIVHDWLLPVVCITAVSSTHFLLETGGDLISAQDYLLLVKFSYAFRGTVSPGFEGFFMIYNIKSVLSAWALMVFKFF